MIFISVKCLYQISKILSIDFSILFRQCQDFMTGKFDRTGFMCTDMACLSRYNALIWIQDCIDDNLVGLGAACQ